MEKQEDQLTFDDLLNTSPQVTLFPNYQYKQENIEEFKGYNQINHEKSDIKKR